jgi:hypothetical protein
MSNPTDQSAKPISLSEIITAEDLCKFLKINRVKLVEWTNAGLPFIRMDQELYFHDSAVAAWLKNLEKRRVSSEEARENYAADGPSLTGNNGTISVARALEPPRPTTKAVERPERHVS